MSEKSHYWVYFGFFLSQERVLLHFPKLGYSCKNPVKSHSFHIFSPFFPKWEFWKVSCDCYSDWDVGTKKLHSIFNQLFKQIYNHITLVKTEAVQLVSSTSLTSCIKLSSKILMKLLELVGHYHNRQIYKYVFYLLGVGICSCV